MSRIFLGLFFVALTIVFASPIGTLARVYWPAIIAIIPVCLVIGPTAITLVVPLVTMIESVMVGVGFLFNLPAPVPDTDNQPQLVRVRKR